MRYLILFYCFFGLILSNSCSNNTAESKVEEPMSTQEKGLTEEPLADYIVDIYEDSKGNLWFGTMSKGAIKFDGKKLVYFTTEDGLPTNAVVDFVEDKSGNMWMATHDGLVRFDGKKFTTYSTKDGLAHFRISQVYFDSNGVLWVGTWGGVSYYDGLVFRTFEMQNPDVKFEDYQTTMDWVTEIIEDKEGHIWISRDGYGVLKFDGNNFNFLTKADGLLSNNVQSILQDQSGKFWIGSRIAERDHPDENMRNGSGGVVLMDQNNVKSFPEIKGMTTGDNYEMYEDQSGNIWIGLSGFGLYKFDGNEFTLINKTNRMDLTYSLGVQALLEDTKGQLWIGMSGGLFKLQDGQIIHVSRAYFNS